MFKLSDRYKLHSPRCINFSDIYDIISTLKNLKILYLDLGY